MLCVPDFSWKTMHLYRNKSLVSTRKTIIIMMVPYYLWAD